MDVDRAPHPSIETRVEEAGGGLQRSALGERGLPHLLVGLARADDAVVLPDGSAHPFPLLDDIRIRFLDQLAHASERFPAPVPEFGDSLRDQLRCRVHIVILEACQGPVARGVYRTMCIMLNHLRTRFAWRFAAAHVVGSGISA